MLFSLKTTGNAGIVMNSTDMLSEMSQSQQDRDARFPLHMRLPQERDSQTRQAERRWDGACVTGAVWEDLEIEAADSHTTLQIYLMSLKQTLKNSFKADDFTPLFHHVWRLSCDQLWGGVRPTPHLKSQLSGLSSAASDSTYTRAVIKIICCIYFNLIFIYL